MFIDRALPPETFNKVSESKAIGEYPKGTLFEVSALDSVQGEHGEFGMMTCSTVVNGKREAGLVRVSKNALQSFVAQPPCLLLYCGTRTGRNGRAFTDVSVTKVPKGVSESSIREVADGWRKMSFTALRSLMSVQSLDSLPANTIFMYKDARVKLLRKGAQEQSLLVDYETEVDGEPVTGTLTIPRRLEEKVKKTAVGIMLWRGPKQSQEGKMFHDVLVWDENTAGAFASVQANQ